jgi:hypothetical protein
MRSLVPGGSGKFCMVRRSPNTLGNFSKVITWWRRTLAASCGYYRGIGTSVGGFRTSDGAEVEETAQTRLIPKQNPPRNPQSRVSSLLLALPTKAKILCLNSL